MQDHRLSHHKPGPRCPCPTMDVTDDEHVGEYVTICAKGECGYLG
jgi:hypothetical protein